MKRGDIAVALMKGDYGKPRPVLIVQADSYVEHTSVTVAMISTSHAPLQDIRLAVEPSVQNGLREPSHVLVDRVQTVPLDRIRDVIGELTTEQMARVDRALALFLGLA